MSAAAANTTSRYRHSAILAALGLLAVVAYLPAIKQPFIEDDFSNIILAQHYGPVSGWPTMLADPVFRLRSASWVLLYALNRAFGVHAGPYYAVMILLHVFNAWLIYALGAWRQFGYQLTAWAAGFFTVYERHQEAVMWISACPELLLVFFGLISFLCWVRFLDGRGWPWYAACTVSFCAALISKESAVMVAGLLALPLAFHHVRRRAVAFLAPPALLAGAAALSLFLTRSRSFRFQDGSFSLHAPVWIIWPDNFVRLFWFWGLIALIAIALWKPSGYRTVLAIGWAWIGISLIPYSFLTYSRLIPSRQTYLASIGLAIIAGFALLNLHKRYWAGRRVLVAPSPERLWRRT